MTFSKKANVSHNKEQTDNDSTETPKRFKKCIVDGDTIIFRCAKFMQDDYIEVTHIPSGRVKEFKNRTSFGVRSGKIIDIETEKDPREKDGEPVKWLGWTNHDRLEKGLPLFTLEDFEIEDKSRLTKQHESYEDALKASLDNAGYTIGGLKKYMDAEDYVFCLGAGKGNYRDRECKDVVYKGNRDGKPIYFEEFKEAFLAQYGKKSEDAVFCEAEDLLQHYAKQEEAKHGQDFDRWEICISYIDKDVDQVYAPSFSYDNYEKGWRYPTKFECEETLVAQTISGDPTDNITGLPSLTDETKEIFKLSKRMGASKKTAEKLLEGSETVQEMWRRAVFCYQQYYGFDKVYNFKDVHGINQEWTWLDYMQQCYVLVKMQEFPDQVPSVRKYLSSIGVDLTEEIKYGEVKVDLNNLTENLETCQTTLKGLKDEVKSYKSLNKSDLVAKLDNVKKLSEELGGNLTMLQQ